jgi:hypothetical protein
MVVFLEDKATPAQIRAIVRLCIAKNIREPLEEKVSNKDEARALIYQLESRRTPKNLTNR